MIAGACWKLWGVGFQFSQPPDVGLHKGEGVGGTEGEGGFVRLFVGRGVHSNDNGNDEISQVHCALNFWTAAQDPPYILCILLRQKWGPQVEKCFIPHFHAVSLVSGAPHTWPGLL